MPLFYGIPKTIILAIRRTVKVRACFAYMVAPIIWVILLVVIYKLLQIFLPRILNMGAIQWGVGIGILITIIRFFSSEGKKDIANDFRSFLNKYTIEKTIASAIIRIEPSGDYSVHINPADVDPDMIIIMNLCYLVKIRWLLITEEQDVAGFVDDFIVALRNAVDKFPTAATSQFRIASQVFEPKYAMLANLPKAYGDGESFMVRLFRKQANMYVIDNTLPQPGLAANIWHSYFVLLEATVSRIPDTIRLNQFKHALQEITKTCASFDANRAELEGLLWLFMSANNAFQAMKSG